MERTGDPGEDYAAESPVADGDPGPSRRYEHLSQFSHNGNLNTDLVTCCDIGRQLRNGRQRFLQSGGF